MSELKFISLSNKYQKMKANEFSRPGILVDKNKFLRIKIYRNRNIDNNN